MRTAALIDICTAYRWQGFSFSVRFHLKNFGPTGIYNARHVS